MKEEIHVTHGAGSVMESGDAKIPMTILTHGLSKGLQIIDVDCMIDVRRGKRQRRTL